MRLLAVALIGLMFAIVKLANQEGVHVLEALFWRQLAGLPVVLVWLWIGGSLRDIDTRKPFSHLTRMIVGISAMALNFWALTLLPLAEATTIGFAVPIFSTIMAAIFLAEPTGKFRWMAVIIGFIGVLIVVQPGGGSIPLAGAAVGLAGALCTATVTILIRQFGKTETTGALVFWFSLTSLIPLGIAMTFVASAHSATAWTYIAILSLAGAGAQICLTQSLRYAPVAVVIPMDYVNLLWATIYGWLFFGMLPVPSTWIGAPIIILAGMVIVWREHRQHRRQRVIAATQPAETQL